MVSSFLKAIAVQQAYPKIHLALAKASQTWFRFPVHQSKLFYGHKLFSFNCHKLNFLFVIFKLFQSRGPTGQIRLELLNRGYQGLSISRCITGDWGLDVELLRLGDLEGGKGSRQTKLLHQSRSVHMTWC